MSPEYGATVGFFPVDDQTLRYLELSGQNRGQEIRKTIQLVEAYCKACRGLFLTDQTPDPRSMKPSLWISARWNPVVADPHAAAGPASH